MTKDGSKRIKELEKDKKSLEQKFSQAEKVLFGANPKFSYFFVSLDYFESRNEKHEFEQ